jgi:hypothetical protein
MTHTTQRLLTHHRLRISVDTPGTASISHDGSRNPTSEVIMQGMRCASRSVLSEIHSIRFDFNLLLYSNWRIILDEILSLIRERSTLLLTVEATLFCSLHEFFSVLSRTCNAYRLKLKLKHTDRWHQSASCLFEVDPRPTDDYLKEGWTFGILVDGSAPECLAAFLDSIHKAFEATNCCFEVIVSGPIKGYQDVVRQAPIPVRMIDEDLPFHKYGWITKKKNNIARAACYNKLVLAHNRYIITSAWLNAFRTYGHDFNVLSVKQTYEDKEYPCWCAQGTTWSYSKSINLDYDDCHPNIYVNGGFIVLKTRLLLDFPLNELLFWNEGEDVEWARRITDNGIVPRFFPYSVARALKTRAGYANGFRRPNKLTQTVLGYDKCLSRMSPLSPVLRMLNIPL